MAREILRFGELGYITKVNGYCYRVVVTNNGNAILDQHQFGRNCSTQKINFQWGQLNGAEPPREENGWIIIETPGNNPKGVTEYVLQDKFYGNKYWRAYFTSEFDWKATEIGNWDDLMNYYGIHATEGLEGKLDIGPKPEPTDKENTFTPLVIKDINWQLIAAIALVLIGIGWIIWKK